MEDVFGFNGLHFLLMLNLRYNIIAGSYYF